MKRVYISAILLFFVFAIHAQTSFVKTLPNQTTSIGGKKIIKTADGGTLIIGYPTLGYGQGIIVTKFDTSYNVTWSNNFHFDENFVGLSLLQRQDKSIVIAGASDNFFTDSLSKMIVFKLTPAGKLTWSKKI